MLTAKEIAKRHKVSNSTARGWLLRGRIQGAELRESELGQSYWVAPESAVDKFVPPRPGPVPKSAGNGGPGKKKRARKKRGE